ncbi:ATP-binding protein [Nocardioides solisilvae]|uniref:ATP-binding protein n=1 Tax=Nocardioides solisilvae TaxID=1542435 RepID=UPI000D7408DE|nr:ATP-binding protein [Nocardioides solisilvae]
MPAVADTPVRPRRAVLIGPLTAVEVVLRCLLLGVAFVLAGQLALRTNVSGTQLALVWPPSGIAAFWLLTSTARTRVADVAALVVAALVSALVSGPPWELVPFRVLSTLGMAVLFRVLVDGWTSLRRKDGSLRPLSQTSTVVALVGAATVAGLLQASVQELGSALVTEGSWFVYLHRWMRNTVSICTIVVTLLLVLARHLDALRPAGDPPEEKPFYGALEHARRPAELVALGATTVAIYVFSFGLLPELPLSFTLFLPAVWAATRFGPAFAALFALGLGVTSIGLTLAGIGSYAAIEDPVLAAFVTQTFLAIVFATTLLLSLTRTELATAEHRAAERARLLDRVLTTVGDGIALVDETGRVVMMNRAATRMLGLTAVPDLADAGQVPLGGFYDMDGARLTPDRLHHVRALAGESVRDEDMVVRPAENAPDRVIRVTAQLMPVPPGTPRQVLVTAHDVTDERAHSTALAAFAGEVAHDLKNPLTVIEGWSEVLESRFAAGTTLDSEEGLRLLARVQGAATHMRTLIGELLSYTLARDRALRPERVRLCDLACEVVALHEKPSEDDRPAPTIELDCDDVVWADPVLLRQVLDNLVGNAVKYVAPDVQPRVRVVSRRPEGEDVVEVRVEDNGIGIAPADRARVFDSFFRVAGNGYAGTGLGLSICQRVVERHGGTIDVRDGPDGAGSTFVLRLPAPRD